MVDRTFLDLFWTISGEDEVQSIKAREALVSTIKGEQKHCRSKYLDYTRERLVKGLKSFSPSARRGFYQTLLRLLECFPTSMPTSQLLELLQKHIYSTSASCKTEETSLRHAYLLSPRLLCESGRIQELSIDALSSVARFLFPLFEIPGWRSQALTVCRLMALTLSPKSIRKVFGTFIEQVKKTFFTCDSETTVEELLFLVTTQKYIKTADDRVIDLSSKQIRKKFVSAIAHSTPESTLHLLDMIVEQNTFKELWPKILTKIGTLRTKQKSYNLLLRLTFHVISSYGDDLTRLVLSEPVVHLIVSQLSNRHLACFHDADSWMRKCLNDVIQKWRLRNNRKLADEKEQDALSPASPETVFSCFTAGSPLCDSLCAAGALKPCKFLLMHSSKALSIATVTSHAKKLMHIFRKPTSVAIGLEENVIRLPQPHVLRRLVASQLLAVLHCVFNHPPSDPRSELINSVIKFYITMGLATSLVPITDHKIEPEINSDDSNACYVTLFRFLSGRFNAPRDSEHLSRGSFSQVLQYILAVVDSMLNSTPEIHKATLYTPYVQKSLSLLQSLESIDTLGLHLANLHAVGCLFSISQGSPDASPMLGLLDDLYTAYKKGRSRKQPDSLDEPPWTAVLTDVCLGFMALASNLLRSCSRAVFEQLVIDGVLDPACLTLIRHVMKTRLHEQADLTHESEKSGEKLLSFDGELGSSEEDSEIDESQISADEGQSTEPVTAMQKSYGLEASSEEEEEEGEGHASLQQTMNDAEMFANDEALAAAFRANKVATPKRVAAERARAVCQTKMRCLDFLECIIRHTSQPNLLLPALVQLIELGSESLKNKRMLSLSTEKREKASHVARYGDLPLLECIINAISCIRSRPSHVQQALLNTMMESPEDSAQLLNVLHAALSVATVAHPPSQLVSMLTTVVQFLFQLASSVAKSHPGLTEVLSQPLVNEFSTLISSARHCKTHRVILLSLLKNCPSFAHRVAPLLAESFLQIMEPTSSDFVKPKEDNWTKSAIHYSYLQCCESVTAICEASLKDDGSSEAIFRFHSELLPKALARLNKTDLENRSSVEWLGSVALATALLTSITQLIKVARKAGFVPVLDPSIPQKLRQLSSSKPIRKALGKFTNFLITTMRETGQNIGSSKEKIRRKKEEKEARRAKRRKTSNMKNVKESKAAVSDRIDVETVRESRSEKVTVPHTKNFGPKKKVKEALNSNSKKRKLDVSKKNWDKAPTLSLKKKLRLG